MILIFFPKLKKQKKKITKNRVVVEVVKILIRVLSFRSFWSLDESTEMGAEGRTVVAAVAAAPPGADAASTVDIVLHPRHCSRGKSHPRMFRYS